MTRRRMGWAILVVLLLGASVWALWPRPDERPPAASSWEWAEGWQATVVTEGTPRSGAPNVVLVLGCTVRRDQLTPYGGHPDVTPRLAAWASEGARFADAIAAAPWTKAASTAVLAGQHALAIGLTEPSARRNHRVLPVGAATLAERLAAAGWYTVGATMNPNLNAAFGLSRGFHRWHDSTGSIHELAHARTGVGVVADLLAQVPARDPDRPVYVQVMLTDAHGPRRVPADLRARFAEDGIPAKVAEYRGALRQLDDAVAALDDGLAAKGYSPQDTLYVFIADHGEGLRYPPHHGASHGKTLYGSVVRVPWLVRGEGVAPGREVTGLASQVDVLPTLLALLGLPRDPALPGLDLGPHLTGPDPHTPRERAFSDSWFHEVDRASVWTNDVQCQRDFGSRRTRAAMPDGCFDRLNDPEFTAPFLDHALMAELVTWRAEQSDAGAAWGPAADVLVDDATIEQLRALGYAD